MVKILVFVDANAKDAGGNTARYRAFHHYFMAVASLLRENAASARLSSAARTYGCCVALTRKRCFCRISLGLVLPLEPIGKGVVPFEL